MTDASDGCGAKFECIIVSSAFDGIPLLERHRIVNGILSEEMPSIHAFQMKTWTPAQYESKKGSLPPAGSGMKGCIK